jgi:TPR repeat protein
MMASGNLARANDDFERAIAHGYRAARVDLALLVSAAAVGRPDVSRAIVQLEQAWKDGVTVAAFELGKLYEHGINRSGASTEQLLVPDAKMSWSWYRMGADAAEPNSLGRYADREHEAAFHETTVAAMRAHWLESFRYYTTAAERARAEDWPDETWRNWRYRRASLARLLARSGMMREVAQSYDQVLGQFAPPLTRWQRLTALLGISL